MNRLVTTHTQAYAVLTSVHSFHHSGIRSGMFCFWGPLVILMGIKYKLQQQMTVLEWRLQSPQLLLVATVVWLFWRQLQPKYEICTPRNLFLMVRPCRQTRFIVSHQPLWRFACRRAVGKSAALRPLKVVAWKAIMTVEATGRALMRNNKV